MATRPACAFRAAPSASGLSSRARLARLASTIPAARLRCSNNRRSAFVLTTTGGRDVEERARLAIVARAAGGRASGGRGGRGAGGRGPGGGGRGSGGGGRGSGARAKGGRPAGKPIARAPPPPPEPGVRAAVARKRVGVRANTSGGDGGGASSPFADLRGGGALLSPAARRDPAKAKAEREKIWARLGAKPAGGGGDPAGFAHLLDPGAAVALDDDALEKSGRGRGLARSTLRVGYAAHRERFAKALRLELEEEQKRMAERVEAWDKDRLRREGYALFGLTALHEGTLQRDAIVRVLVPRNNATRRGGEKETTSEENAASAEPSSEPSSAASAGAPRARQFAMGAELPFHRFGQGDMVTLVEGDEHDASGKAAVTGVVVERAMHFLKIAVDEEDEPKLLDASAGIRLDLSANTTTHDRSLAALCAFSEVGGMPSYDGGGFGSDTGKAKRRSNKKAAEPAAASRRTRPGRRSETAYAPLQRAAIGIPDASGDVDAFARQSPPWFGSASPSVKSLLDASSTGNALNPSQRAAVKKAFGRTLSVWQGPPGTGKTKTLLAFIEAAARSSKGPSSPTANGKGSSSKRGPTVLACAASNVAVDNILEGLLASRRHAASSSRLPPLKIVRLGSPTKTQPHLVDATVGAHAANTPLGREAASLRESARGDFSSRGASIRKAASALEARAYAAVLADADVVCATCVGAGDDLLEGFTFRVACVDEATQCPEPAALIPITKALSAVLVGDARQLPPTVASRDALDAGLGVSLFERLERLGVKPDLLDRQYRMHPWLSAFPSGAFYGGRVASDPTPEDRPSAAGLAWPRARATKTARTFGGTGGGAAPMMFVEVDGGRETRAPDGMSVYNAAEARVAVRAAEMLLEAARANGNAEKTAEGASPVRGAGEVGIIAPYAAQVRLVKELWAKSPMFDERAGSSAGGGGGGASASGLEVHTVDGFQGREKEVIVLCTTRSNERGSLGFVADDRRLNVAMTRARRGLVVLGCRRTLESDETWRRWLEFADEEGLVVKASDVGLM